MNKWEKVIKGLEACELNNQCKPYCQEQGCPYVVHYAMQECIEKLHRDALEMLKEQKGERLAGRGCWIFLTYGGTAADSTNTNSTLSKR